jgi:hypothetical protein
MYEIAFALALAAAQEPSRVAASSFVDLDPAGQVLSAQAVVAPDEFSFIRLKTIADDFHRTVPRRIQIIQIGTNDLDARGYGDKGGTHSSLESVRTRVAAIGFRQAIPQRLGQVICLNERCQMRYKSGTTVAVESWGKEESNNPFQLLSEKGMELLHVGISFDMRRNVVTEKAGHLIRTRELNVLSVDFFVRTNLIVDIAEDCQRLACRLKNTLHLSSRLVLRIRKDPWFVDEWNFPLVYAFDEFQRIPSDKEWKLGAITSCACEAK